jgi:hypothetical protein
MSPGVHGLVRCRYAPDHRSSPRDRRPRSGGPAQTNQPADAPPPKRANRSRCSTTMTFASGSDKIRRNVGRLPSRPDPTSTTTCRTIRSRSLAHAVNRDIWRSKSARCHGWTPAHKSPPHHPPRHHRPGSYAPKSADPPAPRAPAASPPETSDKPYAGSPQPTPPNPPGSHRQIKHTYAYSNTHNTQQFLAAPTLELNKPPRH